MKFLHPFLLILGIGILACSTETQPTEEPVLFAISSASLERSAGPDCESDTASACAVVSLTYPVAKGPSADSVFVQAFNDTIQHFLTESILMVNPMEGAPEDPERAAEQFLTDYMDFIEEVPDYELGWSIESDYTQLLHNEKIVSIELQNYSFSGGAHPNSFVHFMNFDREMGTTISYPSVFTNAEALTAQVEAAFREARELAPDADLNEAGFFWGEEFFLPASFGLTDTGVRFYYNPYEAAPYALGPTEFTISYEQLGALVNRAAIFAEN